MIWNAATKIFVLHGVKNNKKIIELQYDTSKTCMKRPKIKKDGSYLAKNHRHNLKLSDLIPSNFNRIKFPPESC
jgi:hypothetical protein